jgi:hypothetical protein
MNNSKLMPARYRGELLIWNTQPLDRFTMFDKRKKKFVKASGMFESG